MTFGRLSSDLYRLATQQIAPVGISKRMACAVCKRVQSVGQFPMERPDTCITCKPMPKGWRRGGLQCAP